MNNCSMLSPEFPDWAALPDLRVTGEGSDCELSDVGGEIRFYIRTDGSGLVSLSRAERSESEEPIMSSTAAIDIERFVTMYVGSHIRLLRGMEPIVLPWRQSEVAPGYVIETIDTDVVALHCPNGSSTPHFVGRGDPQPVVRYSYYAGSELDVLRESLIDPAGIPLFSLSRS